MDLREQIVNHVDSNVCDKCKSVLREPFISCLECSELFCTSCFAQGAETQSHRSNHNYTIRRDDFELFRNSNWTASEEKQFLNLVFINGVGNWEDIGMEMKKTPEECRTHFLRFYFDGVFNERLGLTNKNAYVRHIVPYLFKTNTLDPPRGDFNNPITKSMAGYRFARSDFDIPFDHSAEKILSNISFDDDGVFENDPDMTATVKELKFAVCRAYNHRLNDRNRHYRIVRSHGLIEQRKTLAWLSRYSDVFHHHSKLARFASFMQISDPTSFDFLIESLKLYLDTKLNLYR